MIAVRGYGSAIVKALRPLLPKDELFIEVSRHADMPIGADRYIFASGVIRPKAIRDQTDEELAETFIVNCAHVIQDCDRLIAENDKARICLIGSESGFQWSFDGAYAAAKAGLHRYVEVKRLRTPEQQLVCLAPTIIRDTAMTLSRNDLAAVDARGAACRKGRWLTAAEMAKTVFHLLYIDRGFISGTVIRMNGGPQ